MRTTIKLFLCILLFALFAMNAFAKNISLDLHNANLRESLQLIANVLEVNLIISPSITGTTSLHIEKISADELFELLLKTHGLTKIAVGKMWLIAPQSEIIQRKQEELKVIDAIANAEPLVTRAWPIRYAKADDIAHLLQDTNHSLLSKRGHVSVDGRTNTLFVQDVASALDPIQQLLKQLDVPVQQIVIEARIANVDSEFEREMGINFNLHSSSDSPDRLKIRSDLPIAKQTGINMGLAMVKLAEGTQLDLELSAMESEGRGNLIASPSLTTANQQTASIESGEEIPYQEVSKSGATSVAFKKAVLSLKVTPQIMPDNRILLQLSVNQDKASTRQVLGVPTIDTRQITTNVLVKNGQTIVLGGIYEEDKQRGEHRIPFLGTLPVIGVLFKQQDTIEKKRELLIFVTPKIA